MDLKPESGPAEGNAGTEDKAPSLDDAINKAMAGAEQEPVADARTETEPKDDEAQEQAKPDPAKPAESDPKQEAADKTAIPELKEAPKHWPEDRRKAFDGLAPEAKAIVNGFVRDLTAGFTRKSQELSDKARYHDAVRSLFDEADQRDMQQNGVNEVQAIKYLVDLNRAARQNPVGYIKWAMQNFGVTPESVLGTQAKPQGDAQQVKEPTLDDMFADPRVDKLSAELEAIKAKEAERQKAAEDYRRRQDQQQEQFYRRVIREFREATDDHGNLKYPHYDTVARSMGSLWDTHPALTRMADSPEKLALAYEMAVRADPELSKSILDQQVQSRLEAERKRDEAERAKRAGGVKRPLGAPVTRAKPASLDDAINAAMAQAGV